MFLAFRHGNTSIPAHELVIYQIATQAAYRVCHVQRTLSTLSTTYIYVVAFYTPSLSSPLLSHPPPSNPTQPTMPQNFTACAHTYTSTPSLIQLYAYTGRVRHLPASPSTQITYAGCKALCGSGTEYYSWPEIASTLTTWVLPVLGILLQAPFESCRFWRTVKAACRWLGSPVGSLAGILWDVKVSGMCALFGELWFYPCSWWVDVGCWMLC